MYNKMARFITEKMKVYSIINQENFDIYVYGIELIIAYTTYFLSLLLVAIITKTMLESLMFSCGFIIIRKYAGGYHASSYLRCQMLFVFFQILFIILLKNIPGDLYDCFSFIAIISAPITIWVYAPVGNKNRKIDENEHRHFKKLSRRCTILISLSTSILVLFDEVKTCVFSFMMGVLLSTGSVVVGYFREKQNQHKEVICSEKNT